MKSGGEGAQDTNTTTTKSTKEGDEDVE